MFSRRKFFSSAGLAVAAGAVAKSALAALPEIVSTDSPAMQPPLIPPNGRPYRAVATLNGWSLPWRMRNGIKEFHLVAEPVIREIAPGEQILFDYSTTMDEDNFEFECLCGSPKCRGRIRDFKHLPMVLRRRYNELGIVPRYNLKYVENL